MTSIFIRDVFSSMLIPAFWIAMIYLAVFFTVRRSSLRDADIVAERGRQDSKTALKILDERYAKGEIRTAEFVETKNRLLGRKVKKKKKRQRKGEEDEHPTKRGDPPHSGEPHSSRPRRPD